MLLKTRGIVFRSVKYSETSIIADIYTEGKGLRTFIISGVRQAKARVSAGLLQVMSLVDMVTYFREEKDVHRIKEIRAAHIYQQLPFDVRRGAIGLFMAEMSRKTIRESEENRGLFSFLYSYFQYLDTSANAVVNLHLHFLLHLSVFLGFRPGGNYGKECPYFDLSEGLFVSVQQNHRNLVDVEHSRLLAQLLKSNKEACHKIKIDAKQRRQLLEHLLAYYRLHIDNFPKINAHTILQEVLN